MNHSGQAQQFTGKTGYGCGSYPDLQSVTQNVPGALVQTKKPELAALIDDLENLTTRLTVTTQRACNTADRVIGMEPEGAGPAGHNTPPPNGTVQVLSLGLQQLRSVIDSLEYHVSRLERL